MKYVEFQIEKHGIIQTMYGYADSPIMGQPSQIYQTSDKNSNVLYWSNGGDVKFRIDCPQGWFTYRPIIVKILNP